MNLVWVNKTGDNWVALCPFCLKRHGSRDETGHLYVEHEQGLYYCFRCQAGGKLSPQSTPETPKLNGPRPVVSKVACEGFPPGTRTIEGYNSESHNDPTYLKAVSYLKSRRVTEEQARNFKLCYCTEGLYKDRLIIPVFQFGKIAYYMARALNDHPVRYFNPKGVSRRGKLFNIDQAVRVAKAWNLPIVLCEGAFSAMRVGYHAVASLGKELDEVQAVLLASYGLPVVVLYDEGAEKDSQRAAQELHSWGTDVRVATCPIPDPGWCQPSDLGKKADPGVCNPRDLEKAVLEAVRYDPMDRLKGVL
jgi:hypothetical protein